MFEKIVNRLKECGWKNANPNDHILLIDCDGVLALTNYVEFPKLLNFYDNTYALTRIFKIQPIKMKELINTRFVADFSRKEEAISVNGEYLVKVIKDVYSHFYYKKLKNVVIGYYTQNYEIFMIRLKTRKYGTLYFLYAPCYINLTNYDKKHLKEHNTFNLKELNLIIMEAIE